MVSRQTYATALNIQDTSSLSGIVHAFSEAIREVWEEAHELGKGTDYVNTHPVCVLFASKIESLCRIDDLRYPRLPGLDKALEACRKGAGLDGA